MSEVTPPSPLATNLLRRRYEATPLRSYAATSYNLLRARYDEIRIIFNLAQNQKLKVIKGLKYYNPTPKYIIVRGSSIVFQVLPQLLYGYYQYTICVQKSEIKNDSSKKYNFHTGIIYKVLSRLHRIYEYTLWST